MVDAAGDLFSLHGKVALVTGASRGIGVGIATALAGAGADIALVARSLAPLEETAARVRSLGRRAEVITADVSKVAEVQRAVGRAAEALGGLDILVNNAGGSGLGGFRWAIDLTEEEWDDIVDLNMKSVMFASQAAAQVMRARGGGCIVNIGSIAGTFPSPQLSTYGAAKAGMQMLTRSLAVEWGRYGIRVNCVLPGRILPDDDGAGRDGRRRPDAADLRQAPLGRYGTPRDIGAAVVYLAAPSGEWVSGTEIVVDGGQAVPSPFRAVMIASALKAHAEAAAASAAGAEEVRS